jgi:hypothetical protein
MPEQNDLINPNLYQDMMDCQWLKDKLRTSDSYAQNMYAAMCNMRWQKAEVWPTLKDEYWSASWRSSGGIVAELRAKGEDYMDYYCSGIKGGMSYDPADDDEYFAKNNYVSEGEVTEEIAADLAKLGWHPSPWPEDD